MVLILGSVFCFFNLEEWGLLASERYLSALSEKEKQSIWINVNLDAVAGDSDLTAMTSGYPQLAKRVRAVSDQTGIPVGIYEPMTPNSDHYHFATAGIPALRLLAGFDKPGSNLRHVLTERDQRNLISTEELTRACMVALALISSAGRIDAAAPAQGF